MKQPLYVRGFQCNITFRLTQNPNSVIGLEGFAFVIHNDAQKFLAEGSTEGGLGYGQIIPNAGIGISNSIALEFDTFQVKEGISRLSH